MQILETLRRYLVSPPSIETFTQYLLAVLTLAIPWLVLLWMLALVLRIAVKSMRENNGALSGVRFAWSWAGLVVALLLMIDVAVVWTLGHIQSWSAITPHVTYIEIGGLIGFVAWLGEHRELRKMQRGLRVAEQGAKR